MKKLEERNGEQQLTAYCAAEACGTKGTHMERGGAGGGGLKKFDTAPQLF